MKAKTVLMATSLLGVASPALAEASASNDYSGLIVWAFLGFCALIVVLQVFPLVRDAFLGARQPKGKVQQQATEK